MLGLPLLPLLPLLFQSTPITAATLPSTLNTRESCQTSRTHCSPGTIIVGKSKNADFTTLQDAITSLPNDNTTATILLLPGIYEEQVNITRQGPITLLGSTSSPKDPSANKVTLKWAAANKDSTGQSVDNVYSSVLVVAPTLNASITGSGPTGFAVPEDTPFGNRDFRAYNIDFRNTWAEYSDGPAHAISFSRANGGFYYCGFYSYQDTVYIGKLGNAYFYKSILAGQTDFLYGFGTAWIQSSELQLRGCGGGITAWKGTNTTFENKYGIYIADSTLKAANSSIAPEIKGECALGRPWNSLHRSIFARCYEDGTIASSGYIDWVVDGIARYEEGVTLQAEYKSYGPGFNKTGRVEGDVTTVLGREGWQAFSEPKKVFQDQEGVFGNVQWIDWDVVHSK